MNNINNQSNMYYFLSIILDDDFEIDKDSSEIIYKKIKRVIDEPKVHSGPNEFTL